MNNDLRKRMTVARYKNRVIAKVVTQFPSLAKRLTDSYEAVESMDVPWTPVTKLLKNSKVAIVTTAGVHHRSQKPFDMQDAEGDSTFREIDVRKPVSDLMITHDYYDHTGADKDINIVFSTLMRLNINKSFYVVSALSAAIIAGTLYTSI
jgi:D-proline reductase (dithiol) PrdB